MKNDSKKIILVTVLIGIALLFVFFQIKSFGVTETISQVGSQSLVADPYVPISGAFENIDTEKDGLSIVLNKIFQWLVATAIILAVLFIVLGAVQYMTTDAVFEKEDGRKRITAAVGGLLLALVSWLILNTINENILNKNTLLNPPQTIEPTAPEESTGFADFTDDMFKPVTNVVDNVKKYVEENSDREDLEYVDEVYNLPIPKNSAQGFLTEEGVYIKEGVNVGGMRYNTILAVTDVASGCCSGEDSLLVLSGGTEIANSSGQVYSPASGHAFEINSEDNKDNWDKINSYILEDVSPSVGQKYQVDLGGQNVDAYYNINSDGVENWTFSVTPQ